MARNKETYQQYAQEIKDLGIKGCAECGAVIIPENYGCLGRSPEGSYLAFCNDCIDAMNKNWS